MSNVRSLCLVSCSSAQSSCSFCLVLLLMVQQYFSLSDSFLVLVVCRMYVHFATIYVSLWCMPYVYIVLFVSVPSFMFFFFLVLFNLASINPRRKAGGVRCYPHVWNLRAVIDNPFLFPLLFFCLVLLLFMSKRGYTSGGGYVPCIYTHVRRELPQGTRGLRCCACFTYFER